MTKRLLLVFLVVVLLISGTGCSGGSGYSSGPSNVQATASGPVQQVTIKAGEKSDDVYYYDSNQIKASPGAVKLTLTNAGPDRPHSLTVKNLAGDGDIAKTSRVDVGKSAALEFTVTQEGTYKLICTIRGHADRGMVGTLTVAKPVS